EAQVAQGVGVEVPGVEAHGGLASLSGGAAAGVGAGEVAGDEGPIDVLREAHLEEVGRAAPRGALKIDQRPVGGQAEALRLATGRNDPGEERPHSRIARSLVLAGEVAEGGGAKLDVRVSGDDPPESGFSEDLGVVVLRKKERETTDGGLRRSQALAHGL